MTEPLNQALEESCRERGNGQDGAVRPPRPRRRAPAPRAVNTPLAAERIPALRMRARGTRRPRRWEPRVCKSSATGPGCRGVGLGWRGIVALLLPHHGDEAAAASARREAASPPRPPGGNASLQFRRLLKSPSSLVARALPTLGQ